MRVLSYSFETRLTLSSPVSDHDFILRCVPSSSESQTVLESHVTLFPPVSMASQRDGFGNALLVGRAAQPHDEFDFISTGMVLAGERSTLHEPAHPMYLRPSRYADGSPEIAALAADVLRVCRNAKSRDKVRRLSAALSSAMVYEPGVTNVFTPASAAFALRRGVCQDFAHVFIALCRASGIHARYVNGLILGHGATHAWVEYYDDHCWRGADPTNRREVDDTYIAFSRGRDFDDCPIESGVFRGGARQSQQVSVTVTE